MQKRSLENQQTLAALHTHTHTHTFVYLKDEFELKNNSNFFAWEKLNKKE